MNLIDNWIMWSQDKRTCGYYLSINPGNYLVDSLAKNEKGDFSKSFGTPKKLVQNLF